MRNPIESLGNWLVYEPIWGLGQYWLAGLEVFNLIIIAWAFYLGTHHQRRARWLLLAPALWLLFTTLWAITPPPGPYITPISLLASVWLWALCLSIALPQRRT